MSDTYTTLLFAKPSWLSGVARTLDIGGTFDSYNVSPTPGEADMRALAADFMAVAQDFNEAVQVVASRR